MKDVIVSQADLSAEEEHLLKEDVINAINTDEEKVRIGGGKIELEGVIVDGED